MMRPLAVSLVDKQDYFLNMEQQVRPTKEYIRSALKTSPIIIVINIKVLRDKQYNWKFTINGSRTNIINEGQSDHKHAFEEYVDCYFLQDGTKLLSYEHWITAPFLLLHLRRAPLCLSTLRIERPR